MTDFGLDDNIISEKILRKMLRWHGLLLDAKVKTDYNTTDIRIDNPKAVNDYDMESENTVRLMATGLDSVKPGT